MPSSTIQGPHTVPAANGSSNLTVRDVIGNKADAAASGATKSLVAQAKQIDAFHDVPSVDGSDNDQIRDVIGNRGDHHTISTLTGRLHLLEEHTHNRSRVIPSGAAGVVVTAGDSNAWDLGSFVVMVATNAITADFDIHFVTIEVMSANATYEIVLYSGADASEVEIARFRIVRVTNQVRSEAISIITPVVAANSQIKAKVMSSTGALDSVTLSLHYHIY